LGRPIFERLVPAKKNQGRNNHDFSQQSHHVRDCQKERGEINRILYIVKARKAPWAPRVYFARLSNQFVTFLYVCDVQSLKGVFQPKAITAAIITISTNSRFMSEIARNAG